MRLVSLLPLFAYSLLVPMPSVVAQEEKPPTVPAAPSEKREFTAEEKANFEKLEKMLTNVRLVGHFTIDGKPLNDLKEEKYEIKSAKKMPEGNAWTIAARIQYAKYDVTVPLLLNIEWAGNTPVLTLDQFTIPGMGTFDARVIFHDGKYIGTWTHDSVGGHLFGRIEKM